MPRLESTALKAVESAGAKRRIRASEDGLMVSMERFGAHVIKRRLAAAKAAGQNIEGQQQRARLSLNPELRETMRERLRMLANEAS